MNLNNVRTQIEQCTQKYNKVYAYMIPIAL